MANSNTITFFTAPFVLSYPKRITPAKFKDKAGVEKGDPHYSFEGISEPASLKLWKQIDREAGTLKDDIDIERVLVALAKKAWPEINVKEAVASKELKWPFKSGTKLAEAKEGKADHYDGKKYWRAKAKDNIKGRVFVPNLYEGHPDGVILLDRGVPSFKEKIGDLFYAGAWCTAEVTAATGDTGGRYITLYLNAVVFEDHGERIQVYEGNIEKFRGVRGGSTDYDPTEGMDSGIDDELPS